MKKRSRRRCRALSELVLLGLLAVPARAERIPCTQEAFEQALAAACPRGYVTITFDCRDTTIFIRTSSPRDNRVVSCDGVTIDGEDRNITFQQDPPCEQGYETTCPDIEGGAWLVSLRGNRGAVRNLTVRSFWEGIHVSGGFGNSVENVVFDRPCDDALTNLEGATGTVFRQVEVRRACDKGIQIYGRHIATTANLDPADPSYYDLQILDSRFVDCKQPIRATQRGRFLVRGNRFEQVDSQGGLFSCDGPRFGGSGIAVYFENNRIEGCRRGVRVEEEAQFLASGNSFLGNALRGAAVYGSALARFDGNRFEGNGGSSSAEAYYGGLAVAGSARVDAGGGALTLDGRTESSRGGNLFLGNRGPSGRPLDVQNLTSIVVRAEGNWWGDLDPSDQVEGPVDFEPWLTAPPASDDKDQDGFAPPADCDDSNPAVHPGAPDAQGDGVDDDCDGVPDDGLPDVSPPAPRNLRRTDRRDA